ncbi:MAG: hypothetical protein HZA92_08055 [Verrucomicrobia bacterium]|nr:hypothetical protein [Verrucomicrobiota bacterium]
MSKLKPIVAFVLLAAFTAVHTVCLPAAIFLVGLSGDHAISIIAQDGHWDIVLSHHKAEAHAAALHADARHDHEHGWATGMLVALAAAPATDDSHVIHCVLSGPISTGHATATVQHATTAPALCPPMSQRIALTSLPSVSPLAAARPPPASQFLLALRTTVLVV